MQPDELRSGLIAQLAEAGGTRSFRRGETVFREGTTGRGIFILLSGKATVFTSNREGREVICNKVEPGEIFGELYLDGGMRSASVRAATDIECVFVDEHEFSGFMAAHPGFAELLVRTLIGRLRHATTLVRRLALHDVSERVIGVLLEESREVDGHRTIPRSLTQLEIANRVGATREMVNRVIKKLTERGYLQRVGRRDMVILRDLADALSDD